MLAEWAGIAIVNARRLAEVREPARRARADDRGDERHRRDLARARGRDGPRSRPAAHRQARARAGRCADTGDRAGPGRSCPRCRDRRRSRLRADRQGDSDQPQRRRRCHALRARPASERRREPNPLRSRAGCSGHRSENGSHRAAGVPDGGAGSPDRSRSAAGRRVQRRRRAPSHVIRRERGERGRDRAFAHPRAAALP